MNYSKPVTITAQLYVVFSIIALLSVSLMAINDPQSVMDLIDVKLSNNDALSSIRGVYGGVGLVICISLVYLLRNALNKALYFLALFWGFYALCRLLTMILNGNLGSFGKQWFITESGLFVMAFMLVMMYNKFVLVKNRI